MLVGSETFPSRIGDLWPLVEEQPHVIGDFTVSGGPSLTDSALLSTHDVVSAPKDAERCVMAPSRVLPADHSPPHVELEVHP
jgi:hypothetical protein